MTAQEVSLWLRRQPFRPFRVTLNNGHTIDIVHPELAEISSSGSLYVYEPTDEGEAQVACGIRNICTMRIVRETSE